ncbi:hypothetical protein TcasGA2_TC031459 [Tribolium castaneum]|uniref:Uncharacterized protein n=1 Tax=Tribolium castaneum TaxID=7070 RepID=A0A139WPG2_TRICA|nr:hypothetical protein TcasGA2_TC031459 [Tribolium castaneum]
MSVRRFFIWTGHNCLKVLKNWSTSIQNRYNRKRFKNSTFSISTFGRGSVSTEITVLEYEITPCMCHNYQRENEVNENLERRWRCKYY